MAHRHMARVGLLALLAAACAHAPSDADSTRSSAALPRPALGYDQPGWQTPPGAYLGERNRCIDEQLSRRSLNQFGDPEGTTYPGGSPLLSLARPMDRYEYVMRHKPDIATTCTKAAGERER